jgi:hypothetical protein
MQSNNLFHLCRCNLPDSSWDVWIRHYEHATLDLSVVRPIPIILQFQNRNFHLKEEEERVFNYLKVMRMPKLPLFCIKLLIQSRRYHILHSDQPIRIGWSIVDQTLSYLITYISHVPISRVVLEDRGREAVRRTSELRCVQ